MITITTTEMHTGGEPVRIVESGYPDLPGETILDKRRYAREHYDHLRTALMHEPRGHYDMYGVIPVEPDHPDADLAVLFVHNQGYSLMCGHAVIAMGRYAVDQGLVEANEPETRMVIQCPCGPVVTHTATVGPSNGRVRFESVAAFAFALGRTTDLPGFGTITYDVSYGGAFYALASAHQFGLEIGKSPVEDLKKAASALTKQVRKECPLSHPDSDELAVLYGSILTDGIDNHEDSANICVFADAQVDRSPTGSGVTARMAARYAKGQVAMAQERVFTSLTGSSMAGKVIRTTPANQGEFPMVTVEVAARAYYTGKSRFVIEPDDPLAEGFLLR